MKRVLMTALIAFPLMAAAQTAPPAGSNTASTGNVANGKRLFQEKSCYYCHGTTGQGGRDGVRITNTVLNVDGVIRYVRKPTGAMPAYTEKLISDQELQDIVAYLKSLPAAKAPKDIPLLNQLSDK
jgi:mono/diheme cytochrome c family protein